MTDTIPPMVFEWRDDGAMHPVNATRADQYYVVGEHYRLVPHEERSARSHSHFFAAIHEAWQNLPIEQAALFATDEHFRKWLLIKTGYRHERVIAAADEAEARKLAALVGGFDQFAVVQRRGTIVTVWTAESQSMRAMKKQRFQESKEACLNEAAAIVGVSVDQLKKNRAA